MGIKNVIAGIDLGAPKEDQVAQEGDWNCPRCNDLQFRRNVVCRRCGCKKPAQAVPIGPLDTSDPEGWIAAHSVNEKATDQFRALSHAQQMTVMNKGSLAGARDMSAVLIGRIKTVLAGGDLGPPKEEPEVKEGDWYCPKCNDLQFRRNVVCRSCGCKNPAL